VSGFAGGGSVARGVTSQSVLEHRKHSLGRASSALAPPVMRFSAPGTRSLGGRTWTKVSPMRIAIPTHPESETVERFGHDFPILLVDLVDGAAPKSSVLQTPPGGCCGSQARSIEGTDLLICAGLGEGAARHLEALGVGIAVVPEGLGINAAIEELGRRGWTSREAPVVSADAPSSCGGHSHDGAHEGEGHGHGGCGGKGACGGHSHDGAAHGEKGHGHGTCGGHGHGHS
jgi:predicted Fe-Mo cluster-binding NifX family protein